MNVNSVGLSCCVRGRKETSDSKKMARLPFLGLSSIFEVQNELL